jgi:hypothetical protein
MFDLEYGQSMSSSHGSDWQKEKEKEREITVEKDESFILTLNTKLISHSFSIVVTHSITNDGSLDVLLRSTSLIFHRKRSTKTWWSFKRYVHNNPQNVFFFYSYLLTLGTSSVCADVCTSPEPHVELDLSEPRIYRENEHVQIQLHHTGSGRCREPGIIYIINVVNKRKKIPLFHRTHRKWVSDWLPFLQAIFQTSTYSIYLVEWTQ